MTPVRRVVPGATYMLTRRCSERRFFLRPSPVINTLVEYALARCAERHGMLLHAFVCLSNHYHCVLTDPDGKICLFLRDFNAQIARSVNAEIGHWEHFWDSARPSLVRLVEPQDVLEKIVYTLANPVSSILVNEGGRWPGLRSSPRDLLRGPRKVLRQGKFHGKRSKAPEEVAIEYVKPPCFEKHSVEQLVEEVEVRLEEEEHRLRRAAKRAGKRFLGRARIIAQDPLDRPKTFARRRKLDPEIACKNEKKRIAALEELKAFRQAYHQARAAYRSGKLDTVFPYGTWWLRVTLGVTCSLAPS